MQNEETRNTIIFVVFAVLLLVIYQTFVAGPAAERQKAAQAREAAAAPTVATAAAPQAQALTREAAVAATPRVAIATPALRGSLSLRGGRIDDLFLVQYRQTVARNAPPVELLAPQGTKYPWVVEAGWTGANVPGLPNGQTLWTQTGGSTLAPGRPVTLAYDNGAGLRFTRTIAVDEKFMFTVTDSVANLTAQAITLAPYASVQRQNLPADLGKTSIVHEGAIGALGLDKATLKQIKYGKWAKEDKNQQFASDGGWIGITDKYWLAAVAPTQTERIQARFETIKRGDGTVFDADYVGQARTVPAGGQAASTTHVFAGAKQVPLLKDYEAKLGIKNFDQAVDWGMFWFITRPMFSFLMLIFQQVGSFGVSILLLTVAIRTLLFPLANKQYESVTKMKKVQPLVEELRKKHKDDPAKQQQEMMALYQREKVNPLAGCFPILIQIPLLYSLYKVLTVTIEMRHAPFMGWIKDLSARDPTSIWTLFGLIPWDPASVPLIGGFLDGPLHLGILPLAYGFTMWLTTSMSPPAPDPMQQKIFQLMPILFTFIMAPFAVGLLIYWTWSNILTGLQQYVIMRRFKVDNPIDQLIRRITGKPAPAG